MSLLSFDKEKLLDKYEPDFALGYGSGVFKQEGYSESEKPVIDLVFGVESSHNWHEANLEKNGEDYSWLVRKLGVKFADYLQEKGAKIYYHPYIKFEDCTIKYGVISNSDLIQDLEERKYLYVAGRMHKPVEILQGNAEVQKAVEKNLHNAVTTAMLLLPENFTEQDLYMTIAGISYTGDHRMQYGENPLKVSNIVNKNLEGFQNLYRQIIAGKSDVLTVLNEGMLQQSTDPKDMEELYHELPLNLRSNASIVSFADKEAVIEEIKKGIIAIVKTSSRAQSNKGVFTAGLGKSIKYVKEKLKKAKRK